MHLRVTQKALQLPLFPSSFFLYSKPLFTKYLRLIVHYGKSLISAFQEFFASIYKTFILAGGLATGLSFYEVRLRA